MPLMLGLYFTLRVGEALGTTWDLCDMRTHTLTIAHQIQRLSIFDFHTLRHTGLTMLGAAHLSANDIMARAGHTDYETTLGYIDRRPEMEQKAAQAITERLRGII